MSQIEQDPIIVFEPEYRGHRMDYCKHLVRYARSKSIPIVLASSADTFTSTEYSLRFAETPVAAIDLGPLPPTSDVKAFRRWYNSRVLSLRSKFPMHHIVVLEGDKFLPQALRLPRAKDRVGRTTILVLRMPKLSFSLKRLGAHTGKALLAKILIARGINVIALSPASPKIATYRYNGMPATPDPVDTTPDDLAVKQFRDAHLSPDRTWLGVFGNITERKNLDLIAWALSDLEQATTFGLLIAGTLSPSEANRCASALHEMERSGVEICLHVGLLSDAELNSAIGAVDAVILAHSSDGPSGILGKALALNTHVIAAGAAVLDEELRRFRGRGNFVELRRAALSAVFKELPERLNYRSTAVEFANWQEFSRSLLNLYNHG